MESSSLKYFWYLTLVAYVLIDFTLAISSNLVDEINVPIKISPAKKYHKKLNKEEGAIRLVGGSNDYEGKSFNR